ncbi:DNA damage-regulated autophagy modulator protein 2 [Nilaparvata lugens]|uniref:DNA damage-regulated autophagy modulator protein 2 n=1 Tax=Nilaparvata lugens TaxID=108931 RepID=UPI00193E10BE|nr:DNA damage-regulated autophagy modulator protein 2 [Nilaparvata lugens]
MMKLCARNVHFLPVTICVIFPVTFIITFLIAVHVDDVFPGLPYISDTGTNPPESCIFSLLLNLCAVLLGGCIYVRHLQIMEFARLHVESGLRLRDIQVATFFGGFSCIGLAIVANFQVTNVRRVHYFGATTCLWGGTVYFIYQTVFSYKMGRGVRMIFIFYTRYVLCVFSILFNISFIVTGFMAHSQYTGDNPRKWKPHEGGWLYHVISSSSEWMLAFTHSFLVFTFLPEFKKVHVELPVVLLKPKILPKDEHHESSRIERFTSNGHIYCDDKY